MITFLTPIVRRRARTEKGPWSLGGGSDASDDRAMEQHVIDEEWSDTDMGRAITRGIVIGVPLMFAVVVLLSAWTDISFWKAAGVALLPAAFVGPYIGGLLAVGAEASRHEVPRVS